MSAGELTGLSDHFYKSDKTHHSDFSATCFIAIAAHEQLEDDLEQSSHCLYSFSVVAIESTKQVGSNINKLLTAKMKLPETIES